ncbi:MAG: hypothetical protein A2275_16830 [Bacteroidetes bacterium RIFOXYA12_FULL_35_11]|nr:MAG: hypothetical protein A2X01_12630 [Bacteroidetes bacterium GWF2_35_48]OFY82216.1 MAG: hypothetical protein A2275_16830 [Bacteroidetes bacterium RIFOXYA12_FULL_35_11]OFY93252.1 MAG: hypothetical protein A2491_16545 [Bacteroidetes bacterium RIFOXYC12_FULL_35_7]HBX49708.1 hypothetical protein [Bacteroidales bacterium]
MKSLVYVLLAMFLFFGGSAMAQKNKNDSAFVKIIFNGNFKFFKKRIVDTTVFMRKDNKLFIQRNGEWIDTLYFNKKVKEMTEGKDKENIKMVKTIDSATGKVIEVPVIIPKYRFSGHWTGVEFGLNTFMNSAGKLQLPDTAKLMELNTGKSWAFHWNILQVSPRIYKNKVGLVTGLGWNFNNYNFENQVVLNHDTSFIRLMEDPTLNSYKKNKLSVSYLTIPLLIEVKPSRHFFFAIGAIGSLKLYSRQKITYSNNRVGIDKNDFYINPLKLDITARLGTNLFTMFMNYSMTPLFEKNKGSEIIPLTVGLGINF